jgi:hypothetical protein
MGHPVKLSDALVLDARLTGEVTERSIAGQIEFWASLGRAVESLLRIDNVIALKQRGADRPLSECLSQVDSTEGRERLRAHLATRPFPHYEPALDAPGFILRTDADGTRTLGRFVQREFRPVEK